MNFRRLPFQFSTTDPAERQRELERRFGLPSSRNMFVDVPNTLSAGAVQKETSSPRLQHRVPIFAEGYDQSIHSSVDSMGSASEIKKPKVRVIPIEVEGAESRSTTRHRTFSGPPRINKEHNECPKSERGDTSPLKHSMEDLTKPSKIKLSTEPKVHNIPIQIEGANNLAKSPKIDKITKSKEESPMVNGCSVSKSFNKVKSPDTVQKIQSEDKGQKVDQAKIGVESSLKKIENVLEEFKAYETGVQEFSGTSKDKQYRYLDEMLTRCMLRLDDINTMGNENVRSARKNAVKKIQAGIDLLESKANAVNEVSTTSAAESEPQIKIADGTERNDVEMQESQDIQHEALDSTTAESEAKSPIMQETSEISKEGTDGKSKPQTEVVDKIESNDVEMQEGRDNQLETQDNKQEINAKLTEVGQTLPPQNTAANGGKVEMTEKLVECQAEVEISNEVPEIEMAEIKATSSTKDFNSGNKVSEVEMTDSCNADHSEPKSDLDEIASETKSVQASSDIEMKDIHSTLDDVAEHTVIENTTKSTPSLPEEQDKSVLNIEAKNSNDTVEKSTLSTEVSDCS